MEGTLTESMTSTWMPSLFKCCRKIAGRGLTDFPVPISKISGEQERNKSDQASLSPMDWQMRRTGFGDDYIKDLKPAFVPSLPECWWDIPEKNFSLKEDARRR